MLTFDIYLNIFETEHNVDGYTPHAYALFRFYMYFVAIVISDL